MKERIDKYQIDAAEHEANWKWNEAKQIYWKLNSEFPKTANGLLGIVNVLEKQKSWTWLFARAQLLQERFPEDQDMAFYYSALACYHMGEKEKVDIILQKLSHASSATLLTALLQLEIRLNENDLEAIISDITPSFFQPCHPNIDAKRTKLITQISEQLFINGHASNGLALIGLAIQHQQDNSTWCLQQARIKENLGSSYPNEADWLDMATRFNTDIIACSEVLNYYLRHFKYRNAATLLEEVNKRELTGEKQQHYIFLMNIRFAVEVEDFETGIKWSKKYIEAFPNNRQGYHSLYDCLRHTPQHLNEFESIHQQILNDELPVSKNLVMKVEQRYYSLLKITTDNVAKLKTSHHLMEHLQTLQYLNIHAAERAQIVDELLDSNINLNLLKRLLHQMKGDVVLETKVLRYIASNRHWLVYQAIDERYQMLTQKIPIQTQSSNTYTYQEGDPIDIVFTWVDIDDPVLQKKYEAATGSKLSKKSRPNDSRERYENNQEIILALKSIQKFFNKLNRIYIVTNNQQFNVDFLEMPFREKVIFIDHKEIFPKNDIKIDVFNSYLIETFLHRIPDLSECFLYFNDDVIIGDYITTKDIFNAEGKPYALLQPIYKSLIEKQVALLEYSQGKIVSWIFGRKNAIDIFNQRNESNIYFDGTHQGMILLKQSLKEVVDANEENWKLEFYKEVVRGQNAVFVPLLAMLESIRNGAMVLRENNERQSLSKVFVTLNEENEKFILEKKPIFYCLNKLITTYSKRNLKQFIESF